MKMRKIITMLVVMIINNFAFVYAADTDYLLLQDISSYKFITQNRDPLTKKTITIPGYTTRTAPGVLAGADHFDIDHDDTTYETVYESDITDLGVRVQVTKHAGSDSDKWLLHEVDADFRNYYGIPGMAYTTRQVDSQTMLVAAVGGREYRWLSGNKVVVIKYHGSLTQKPEPLGL
jgi:hypothetical protein